MATFQLYLEDSGGQCPGNQPPLRRSHDLRLRTRIQLVARASLSNALNGQDTKSLSAPWDHDFLVQLGLQISISAVKVGISNPYTDCY